MEVQGLKELTLTGIAEMDDGRIGEAFRQALKRVATDMDDRPGDKRPRKVSFDVACIPVVADDGLCDGIKLQVQVKDSIPTRKSKVYDLGLRKGGMMVYQPMTPENHLQQPLPLGNDDDQ